MGKSDEKQSVTSVTGVFRVVMRPISCKVEGGERWKQHRLYGISLKPRPVHSGSVSGNTKRNDPVRCEVNYRPVFSDVENTMS